MKKLYINIPEKNFQIVNFYISEKYKLRKLPIKTNIDKLNYIRVFNKLVSHDKMNYLKVQKLFDISEYEIIDYSQFIRELKLKNILYD